MVARLLTVCAVAIAMAACGAEPQPEPRRARVAGETTALRFVTPPLVVYDPEWRSVDVWVRLNRPLRHNVGRPEHYAGHEVFLEIDGTVHDIVGVYRNHLFPTCYGEDLSLRRDRELVAGQQVEVTLWLREEHRLIATVPVVVGDLEGTPQAQLGCPASRRAVKCEGEVRGRHVAGISVVSASGVSCDTARAVLRRVGRWASGRCYEDLCARRNRRNGDFRCFIGLSGEAAWDIVCRRGRDEVRGYTAD